MQFFNSEDFFISSKMTPSHLDQFKYMSVEKHLKLK